MAKKRTPEALAIPAGLFIGMGVGFLVGNLVALMFLGLGLGFLVTLIVTASKKHRR